ncbi:unnamed protein product [Trichobilharzia regenti]|nr:unnamed protein product [Trichobilharzia regenti]
MLDLIDRQRSIELRSQTVSKSAGGSCSDMSSPFAPPRNLPLIAMQRPTIDSELLCADIDDPKLSRSSLDYRRSSGSEVSGTSRWSRNSLLLQRLQASQHRSESLLFNTKHRNCKFYHNDKIYEYIYKKDAFTCIYRRFLFLCTWIKNVFQCF